MNLKIQVYMYCRSACVCIQALLQSSVVQDGSDEGSELAHDSLDLVHADGVNSLRTQSDSTFEH